MKVSPLAVASWEHDGKYKENTYRPHVYTLGRTMSRVTPETLELLKTEKFTKFVMVFKKTVYMLSTRKRVISSICVRV